MFGNIFGSDEKDEIQKELEKLKEENKEIREELDKKDKKLEKEKKRAKEAITEKQKTDKKLKEANHKIESLEDRIKNLENQKKEKEEQKKTKFLTKTKTISFINELETLRVEKESIVTHYIEKIEEVNKKEKATTLRGIDSQSGYIYLKDQFNIIELVIVPPIPTEREFYRDNKFKLEKIRKALTSDKKIGFVSAHAGKSAIGTILRDEFTNFEIIKGEVKGKHSKGGFSQGRFERGREEQIQKHAQKLVEKIDQLMENIDYLILDGNRKIVSKIEENISIKVPKIYRSLDISEISQKNKEDYVEKALGSRIYVL